jgi:hypothetical protein
MVYYLDLVFILLITSPMGKRSGHKFRHPKNNGDKKVKT